MAYGLANRGAGYLKHARKLLVRSFDWSGKNRSVRRLFLEHALLISEVTTAVELACRAHPKLRFYLEAEMPLPEKSREKQNPFKWSVTLRRGVRVGVVPDRVFAVERESNEKTERVLFCLEADRGTMPVKRSDERASSFAKKLSCYTASADADLPSELFGTKRMRVLTVTNTFDRLTHLREAARGDGLRRGLFLFACADHFKDEIDPVADLLWSTPRGDAPVALFESVI